MKKTANKGFDPATTAWRLFEKTGNPSYYMLYKKLTED